MGDINESKSYETMKALVYASHARSSALSIIDAEMPVPESGQVLVKTIAFAINPVDVKLLENPLRGKPTLPHIPCLDFSGVVIENKHVKDSRFTVGDVVMGMMPSFFENGCASEYLVVAEEYICLIPRGFDPVDMASLPLVGCTVVEALGPYLYQTAKAGDTVRGKKILITGACGGVGSFAVQVRLSLPFPSLPFPLLGMGLYSLLSLHPLIIII